MKLERLCVILLPAVSAIALGAALPESSALPTRRPDNQPAAKLASTSESGSAANAKKDSRTLFALYTRTALTYQARGAYAEAEKQYRLSLQMSERAYGENSEYTASAFNRIGQVCFLQGRFLQARSCFRSALRVYETEQALPSSSAAVVLANLAAADEELGRATNAEESFRKAVEFFGRYAPEHPSFGTTLTNYALLLAGLGQVSEGKGVAERGITLLEKQGSSVDLAAAYTTLARLDMAEGDYTPAGELLSRSYNCLYRIGGLHSPVGAALLTHQARFYAATARPEEARPLFEKAIRLYTEFFRPDHPAVLTAMRSYAKLLRDTRQKKEARKVEAVIARSTAQSEQESASTNIVDIQTLLHEGAR